MASLPDHHYILFQFSGHKWHLLVMVMHYFFWGRVEPYHNIRGLEKMTVLPGLLLKATLMNHHAVAPTYVDI